MLVLRRFLLVAVLLTLGATTAPAVAPAQTPVPTPAAVDRTPGILGITPATGPHWGGYEVRVNTRSSSGTVQFDGQPVEVKSTIVGDDFANGIAYYTYVVVVPPGVRGSTVDVTVGGTGGVTPTSNDFTYADTYEAYGAIDALIYGSYGGPTTGGNMVAVLVSGRIDPGAVLFFGDRPGTDTKVEPNGTLCVDSAGDCPQRSNGWIVWADAPPGEAGPAELTIRTQGATLRGANGGVHYRYVAAPTIESVNPTNGPLAGGGTVDIIIAGDWITESPTVTFGGVPASEVSYESADGGWDDGTSKQRITAKVPPGVRPGTVDVRVRGRGRVWPVDVTHEAAGATPEADDYTYLAPTPPPLAPVITGHGGGPGYANIGGLLIVRGSNLGGLRSVKVDGRAALRLSATPTMIVAFAPPLAKGAYPVTVTTTAGTASAPVKYVYRSLF